MIGKVARSLLHELSPDARTTERLGAWLSQQLGPKPGDFVALEGAVGVGKSVFARGFVRQATGVPDLKVLSPTFLLEQEYPLYNRKYFVRHFDLYRFSPEMTLVDARALEWEQALSSDVCLVEWTERIKQPSLWPRRWIRIRLDFVNDTSAIDMCNVVIDELTLD